MLWSLQKHAACNQLAILRSRMSFSGSTKFGLERPTAAAGAAGSSFSGRTGTIATVSGGLCIRVCMGLQKLKAQLDCLVMKLCHCAQCTRPFPPNIKL